LAVGELGALALLGDFYLGEVSGLAIRVEQLRDDADDARTWMTGSE
jgi:hypothetical protein